MSVRFIRPSEIITQLRAFRTVLEMSATDFHIYGASDFYKASESADFVQTADAALYVMTSNSSSSTISLAGSGSDTITHSIDIFLYRRLTDVRGQASDELAVWFKEFIIRALFGWSPGESLLEPLQYAGDTLDAANGAANYARTYQVQQTLTLDQSDVEANGYADDLTDFATLYNTVNFVAADFDDSETIEIEIDIEQD